VDPTEASETAINAGVDGVELANCLAVSEAPFPAVDAHTVDAATPDTPDTEVDTGVHSADLVPIAGGSAGCETTVESPHFSPRAGGILSKARITCWGSHDFGASHYIFLCSKKPQGNNESKWQSE